MKVYNAIMVAKKTNTGCSRKLRFLLSTTSPLWLSGPHDWLLEMCICGLLPLANHFMTTNHSSAAGKGSIQKFSWKRRTFSGIPCTPFLSADWNWRKPRPTFFKIFMSLSSKREMMNYILPTWNKGKFRQKEIAVFSNCCSNANTLE